jgi:hypothetical protein
MSKYKELLEIADLQVVLDLQTCRTKGDVLSLLNEVRASERERCVAAIKFELNRDDCPNCYWIGLNHAIKTLRSHKESDTGAMEELK